MLFSYGYGQQKLIATKKYTSNAGDFDHQADAVVGCRAHRPIYQASLEATGCHRWASACAALLRRPPWSTSWLKKHKTLTK